MATSTARPRLSSPMPGPCSTAPLAPDVHVGPFGKDRVQMGGDHDVGTERRTGPVAEDVAGLVDPHVPQAGLLKQPLHLLAARGFLERGRGNLGQADLVLDGLGLAGLRGVERRPHRRLLLPARTRRGPVTPALAGRRDDARDAIATTHRQQRQPDASHTPNSIQSMK